MQKINLPSPAKLNLFLHVIGQRSDSYHLLQTLFQFIDLQDNLIFEWDETHSNTSEYPIALHGMPDIPLKNNLIYQAAQLLITSQKLSDLPAVKITIQKKIPMGSGLGGGSSNAATTLLALNAIWKLNLNQRTLTELGAQLGADVPIFIFGHAAWGENLGEKLTIANPPEAYYLVISPDTNVPTQSIFQDQHLTRNTKALRIDSLDEAQIMPYIKDENKGLYQNDLTPVVCKNYPIVKEALKALSHYGYARVTGTGSSVFAKCHSLAEANKLADQLSLQYPKHVFVAKGLNSSPLLINIKNIK